MKLPNGDNAVVQDQKLYGYLLNEQHEHNPGHAVLFRRLLGITPDNAGILREALLRAAADEPIAHHCATPFGVRYQIDFSMTGPRGRYTIRSAWQIEHDARVPRLVTAYVE